MQEFAHSAELGLSWHMDVAAAPELPERLAMAVFRIVQEMLSNVGRHAHARHLAVRITCTATALRVSVQDDGVGAPAHALEAGNAYGILGMRERARHFGGQVSIRSTLGQGTTTVLNVQLTNHWPKAPEPVFDHDHAD